ncbi:MAG: roadblock/LC7 domain-containing protein [Planctomycetes bacterium]|nr:roadblock/LC7 domain-containing protein [Planctomycetota bacterium]
MNDEAGITGSMVITPDGIMVSAALGPELEEDAMAAFASSLLLSLKRALTSLRVPGSVKACTLNASKAKIMFLDMQNSYLVLVSETHKALDADAPAVVSAVQKITRRRIA